EREPLAVVGEAEAEPAAAVEGGEHTVGRGLQWIDDVERRARGAPGIVLVDGLRRVDDPVAPAVERPPERPLFVGAERGRLARRDVVAEDTEDFVAAAPAREHEVVALR